MFALFFSFFSFFLSLRQERRHFARNTVDGIPLALGERFVLSLFLQVSRIHSFSLF